MSYAKALYENNNFFKRELNNYTDLKKNILALNIYYSEFKYTEIAELEKTSLIDLICNIGGTLGLFLGASLLSLVEIFEALLAIVSVGFEKIKIRGLNLKITINRVTN
jgi:hypothetical protein